MIATYETNFRRGIGAVAFSVLLLVALREYWDLHEIDLHFADIPVADFQPSIHQLSRRLGEDDITQVQIPTPVQNQNQNQVQDQNRNQANANGQGKKVLDEKTKQRYRINYLGGLSPVLGDDELPKNLRNLWSERDVSDIAFFWHIPKVRFEICTEKPKDLRELSVFHFQSNGVACSFFY